MDVSLADCLMRSAEQHPGDSALDPVAHVGDTVFTLKNPDALKLNLLGSQVLEQAAPLAEEHRDDM